MELLALLLYLAVGSAWVIYDSEYYDSLNYKGKALFLLLVLLWPFWPLYVLFDVVLDFFDV